MKKLLKNSTLALALLISIPASLGAARVTKVSADGITGDLYGSARIKCVTKAGSDTGYVTELNVGGAGSGDFSGTGVYIRMKNYTSIETPITFKINSTNTVVIAPTTGVNQTYYDKDGEPITGSTARGWGNYLMLPANFDGFIYMNYSTQMTKIGGEGTFDPAHIWRVYIEYSGFYDDYADFAIGDIFTDTKTVLDTSALDETAFAATFTSQTPNQTITQNARSESFVPSGDLLGGARAIQEGYGGFMVKSGTGQPVDLSNGGVYARVKNVNTSTTWLMMKAASGWFSERFRTGQNGIVHRYDSNGENETEIIINEWGYFELPGSFDGFLHLPFASFSVSEAGEELHPNAVNAIYFEADGLQIEVGDIFSKDNTFYDGSEYYASEFTNHTETWSGATITLLDGYKEVEVPLFDYTQIEYTNGLERGVEITAVKNPDNTVFSTASINFATNLDLHDGEAVAINMKGIGSYAFGLEFYDKDDNVLMMPAAGDAATKPIHFIKDGVASSMNHTTGDANTIHEIAGEGVIVAQKDFLAQKAGTEFDWSHIKSIKVRIHTFYDNGIDIVLGDIGTVNQGDLEHNVAFAVADITGWSGYYAADDEFVKVKQYSVPKPSKWIGDVKIIDSLNYLDDEEMNKAVNYDSGDNVCSYHRQDDGLFVHIGPYETGHAYGNYMCLGLFDKGATTDRAQAYKMVEEEKVYAKGLTFYAKNLSVKEIGVTLQFDEKIPGKAYTERWCIVGYPAIYYAYDVVKDAEYMLYSKSDQVQIPVGFEGYIRVPFESYSVPEWNKGQEGVDEVLSLDNFSGNFFFTSDDTRYEDLEFFIKNIGMYFNETRKGNMFDNSNTIKANMGL